MSFFSRPAKLILHPTDFSEASESAFAHALAIAIMNKAELTILHVIDDRDQDVPWHDYPAVRTTLERWGYLEPGATRSDISAKLGIKIKKAVAVQKKVSDAIVALAEVQDFDLIVMATNENRENPFHFRSSIAIPVSEKTQLPTLFVPQDVQGCVSLEDGATSLNQVLVPVTQEPDSQPILDRMAIALKNAGESNPNVALLHVGEEDQFPVVIPPGDDGITWTKFSRKGNVANAITASASELNANVIAMVTAGKKGFWDAVLGSTVQQVLRKAPCPVFTIPDEQWR